MSTDPNIVSPKTSLGILCPDILKRQMA